MSWPTISDTEIGVGLTLPDVRASVSGRLLTKMRERDRRLCQPFQIPSDISATLTPGSWPYNVDWTTVATLYLKPPTHLRGDQGSTLTLQMLVGITRAAARNYVETAFARVQVVGYETVITPSGSELSVTFTNFTDLSESVYGLTGVSGFWTHPHASGPTLVTANLQLKVVSNAPGLLPAPVASLTIARSRGAVHKIEAEPR